MRAEDMAQQGRTLAALVEARLPFPAHMSKLTTIFIFSCWHPQPLLETKSTVDVESFQTHTQDIHMHKINDNLKTFATICVLKELIMFIFQECYCIINVLGLHQVRIQGERGESWVHHCSTFLS